MAILLVAEKSGEYRPEARGHAETQKAPGFAGGTVSQRDVTWRSGHQMPQAG